MSIEKEKLQKDIFNKVDKIFEILKETDTDIIHIGIISQFKDSIIYNVNIKNVGNFITSSLEGIWGIYSVNKFSTEDVMDFNSEDVLENFYKNLISIQRQLKIKSILKNKSKF